MSTGKSKRIQPPGCGMGNGYEQTDPDYEAKRIARMRAELKALDPKWRQVYLNGLMPSDRKLVFREDDRLL